jgi:hypothetical protein
VEDVWFFFGHVHHGGDGEFEAGKDQRRLDGEPMDYRCEDDRFPLSASCVTISSSKSLSSISETEVNPGIRNFKALI